MAEILDSIPEISSFPRLDRSAASLKLLQDWDCTD
jgi:hypothetical protein